MSNSTNQLTQSIPTLNETQLTKLNQAITGLDQTQLIWASGYLFGVAQQGLAAGAPAQGSQESKVLTILYGSQTGNAEYLAKDHKKRLEAEGYPVRIVSMADYKPKDLKKESHLLVIVSTHGEGEPPDDAAELWEFLGSKKASKLDGLKFAVVALGDSSYEFFCQTGKDFDTRIAKQGATALKPRLDCDVDYLESANAFITELTSSIKDELSAATQAATPIAGVSVASAESAYNKLNPFTATLLTSVKITGRDSVKDIRHIEISLADSGLQYQPGDALGVWFENDAALVDEIVALTKNRAETEVTLKEGALSLAEALKGKLELTLSYPGFVRAYAEAIGNAELKALSDDRNKLRDYLVDRQIIDVIREYPAEIPAQQLVESLRPLTPRLYSIASSQAEVEDEVHLTIGLVEYEAYGKPHLGGASGYLCKHLEEGDNVRVYVESNKHFRLPEDPNTPIIMVGPGTGIAPFRSFLQQREAEEAEGKNWLFFGNPNFTQDFLYQVEIQKYVKSGLLDKVSLAFSRDQQEKIYVQHRMIEAGKELYEWLEQGAHFYVCGDANRMAKDVNDALVSIVKTHGNKNDKEAEQYVNDLRRAKRYQKDVY
ncbi:assimilatory sulfite reductase (NADPH) flavoprotein subunit [Alteromonas sp. a30]|uniref:assimilatory sulfite reductase (NADPH) flavoprotein subunit n=1 Tax=Alteromonas sp. a30 TaxID=2730917 RepID=UPI00227E4B4C|nr:assimilatory sulfite reductase (NADPH) flavoprotein subunit [Alteromonas sp. a30]MCY7296548.1 assimilatory sulfite reductase (NADPH) flavoprotein subunit [Alteromonas sp. a30]